MDFDDCFVYTMIMRYKNKNQKLQELAEKFFIGILLGYFLGILIVSVLNS